MSGVFVTVRFLDGRAPDDKREAGVGYAIKTSLVGKLACTPRKRRMTASWLCDWKTLVASIISAYAPTMINTDETKDKFYENFEYVISAVRTADKLIILMTLMQELDTKLTIF